MRTARIPTPVFLSALATLAACASGTPAASIEPATGPTSEHAPRPFTAEQIRAAWTVGSASRYRRAQAGQPDVISETRVADATDTHATFVTTTTTLDGGVIGEPMRATSTWTELMEHATFPAAATTVEDVTVETPAGTFDAWRYTVRLGATEADGVRRYFFAKSRPGAPVRYEHEENGEQVFRVELISVEPAPR